MRSLKSAKSSGSSNQNGGDNDLDFSQGRQADASNRDVMCLVYPDGRTTTVQPQANPT